MTNDIPTIARALTKAQRKAILWCNADGSFRDHEKGSPSAASFYAMSRIIKGKPTQEISQIYILTVHSNNKERVRGMWPMDTWGLTPLGLAVRAYLKENEG